MVCPGTLLVADAGPMLPLLPLTRRPLSHPREGTHKGEGNAPGVNNLLPGRLSTTGIIRFLLGSESAIPFGEFSVRPVGQAAMLANC